jgi:hypothetical protein
MAADLLKSTKPELKAQSGDSGRALAVKHAYNILKEEQMFRWGRGSLTQEGVIPKVAAAVGLEKVEPNDIAHLQKLLDAFARGDADRGILDFYEAYGREKPGQAKLKDIKKKIHEALQSTWKDLARSHTIVRADGRQRIKLEWQPEVSRFLIKIEDDGDEDTEPFQTTIGGDVKAEVSEDGQDTKLSVVPWDDPIKPMTAEDLENMARNIYGEWYDQEGNLWIVGQPEGSPAGPTPPAPRREETPARKIAALEDRINEIKNSRIYVWENPQTGEVVKQERFKRLQEPFEYKGQDFASPKAQEETARLKQEIQELSRTKSTPPVQAHDPAGFDEAQASARARAIRLSREDSASGHTVVYDEAIFAGSKITARRTLTDVRELGGLPERVKQQLVARWSPPEWLELTLEQDEKTGDLWFEGQRWRLHVTYDGDTHEVERIHTPYSTPLKLTEEGPDKLKLRFVKKEEGAYQEIEGNLRFYGEPLFLEARYDSKQEEDEKVARLEWEAGEGGQIESMELVLTRTSEDPRLYRSEVFYVMPPPIPEELLQPSPDMAEQTFPEGKVEP